MTRETVQCPDGHYVLVVDDDDDLRDTMELVLSSAGRAVLTAANGAEALRSLQGGSQHPCLILLDLMMPVMDGFELLRRMDAHPALARVPVIILTGAGPLADKRAAQIKVEVLRKPVERNTILAAVDRFCPAGGPESLG